jgi:allophanate hydrolase subunit 1
MKTKLDGIRENLIRAIRENKSLSDTQKAILETLTYFNPIWKDDLGVKEILVKDDNVIWLHTKNNNKVVNVEIVYDYGSDLYIVKFHKLKGFDVETTEFEDVYFDELYRLLQEQISKLVYGD